MNKTEILKYLTEINSSKIKFAIADIDGVLRGKIIHIEKFKNALDKQIGFCNVIFGWDSADVCYDNTAYTGWHSGYPDAKASIDLQTLRSVPWDNNIPFFLADFSEDPAKNICPRSLLKRIEKEAIALGFTPKLAQEFEWFNFIKPFAKNQHPETISKGMFGYSLLRPSEQSDYFNGIFDLMNQFDIPLEGLHTETGPGVYEAAIIYDTALRAADKAILFKAGIKEIASKHNILASFMAKWNDQLPGCSGHIHQSLWNTNNQNVFYDSKAEHHMSKTMRHYLAGQLHCLPEIMPMYAPTINSYKRLRDGAWAPTTITWGFENRTTAVRVINGNPESCRLEMRVPGSDTNPYLAMAASLASGLYGIKHKLELNTAITTENGYLNKSNGTLPSNLYEANKAMKNSSTAKELFGEIFVNHFTATRDWEWREYEKSVSNWELNRYLEII